MDSNHVQFRFVELSPQESRDSQLSERTSHEI